LTGPALVFDEELAPGHPWERWPGGLDWKRRFGR